MDVVDAVNNEVKENTIEEINVKNNKTKKEKKPFTIFGFTITKLLAYFIIYSVIGFIIETIFGLLTKGVVESRKSFLYGPFCGIYGLGAVVMIVGLQKFKKNNYTLFIGGFIIGSIVEYVISLIGELIFNIKWWDYSNMPFNINGRICFWYSIFWGLLAIYLMSHVNPKVDKYIVKYTELYEQPGIKKFVDTHFSNEKMMKTFPNIKVTQKDGTIIWICDILNDIQPYYFRVFTPKR